MKKIQHLLRKLLPVLLLALFSSTATAQSLCDRACLTRFIDMYFDALASGNPDILPVSAEVKVSDNNRLLGPGDAFWEGAGETVYRWDIVNPRLGDTAAIAVIQNDDGSKTMQVVRLKVQNSIITEIETITANEGDAGGLWDPDHLTEVSPALQLSIRPAEQESYYGLIAAAEGYWRAFQTNGTEEYHQAPLLPDTLRIENGLQTTGLVRDGVYASAARGFDEGRFIGRNLWDRRYPVVDTERGIVLSIVRFGLKDGMESQSAATSNDRLVAEFFSVKSGMIQEIHAVLYNLPDAVPGVWESDYGPARGGW